MGIAEDKGKILYTLYPDDFGRHRSVRLHFECVVIIMITGAGFINIR